jgi:Haemolysin-type calcium binding protein related domain/RTX calcium-binding nonapeptide repeat (4 copies)
VFGTALTQDNVTFLNVDGDLLIKIDGQADRLVVLGGYLTTPVENFRFADGSVLTIEEVRTIIRANLSNTGQDLLDTRNFEAGVQLEPGTGFDRVIMGQDRVVLLRPGDGLDSLEMGAGVTAATVIFEDLVSTFVRVRQSATDTNDLILSFISGDQLLVRGAAGTGAMPTFQFADGQVWGKTELIQASIQSQQSTLDDRVRGSDLADQISGGRGDDLAIGGLGNDSYFFTLGDGNDVIEDTGGADRLVISGYRAQDLQVERLASGSTDLRITFATGDDSIIIRANAIETIEFGDGSAITAAALLALADLNAGDGDDLLLGSTGAQTISGGQGNDTILDGEGADTYLFALGDGQDRIGARSAADGFGEILFDAGIAPADVTAKRDVDGNLVLLVGALPMAPRNPSPRSPPRSCRRMATISSRCRRPNSTPEVAQARTCSAKRATISLKAGAVTMCSTVARAMIC